MLLFFTGAGSYYIISKTPLEIISTNENKISCGTKDINFNSPANAFRGKVFFQNKCASCHQIFKHSTGPALMNLEQRGPWSDRSELYKWIKNPSVYMKTNKYTKDLKATYGSTMLSFSDITNEEIDAIVEYINASQAITY